jgi:predicted methyltransferase
MKAVFLAAVAAIAFTAVSVAAAPVIKPYLVAALADPGRAADVGADARRKPGEILAFAGLKPGDKVVDLIPGGGYFTKIFAKVVGPKGHVFVVWPNEYAAEAHPDPENSVKLSQQPGYGNVSVIQQPAAAFAVPDKVDLVFTSQNYHDYPDKFMGKVDPIAFDRQVYKALKPGGVFLIIDHAAQAGSGMRDTDTLHRIDPAIVKVQMKAAGFVFDGESDVLRNGEDDHTKLVFDKTIRGHTDQFIYKFRKPK